MKLEYWGNRGVPATCLLWAALSAAGTGCDLVAGIGTYCVEGTEGCPGGGGTTTSGAEGGGGQGGGPSGGGGEGGSATTSTGPCSNGVKDRDETDVDCGGTACAPCELGKACSQGDDCVSSFCADGVCCNAACDGHCQACTQAAGGPGPDGQCGATAVCGSPVAAGRDFTCAVTKKGAVKCWGRNSFATLGNGTKDEDPHPTPVEVLDLVTAVGVSAADEHACALLADGTVRCWGANGAGQLGTGTNGLPEPQPVTAGVFNAMAISVAGYHSCALLKDSTVKCWGRNQNGEIGDGTTVNKFSPTTVTGLTGVKGIASGAFHTCAVLADNGVACWGANTTGQLGDGVSSFDPTTVPTPVPGLSGVVGLDLGLEHSCATLANGTARCWGKGLLGDGMTSMNKPPVQVGTLTNVAVISAGGTEQGGHTCAVSSTGTWCWGANHAGQLGVATTMDQNGPTQLVNLGAVSTISAGGVHTCAMMADGTLRCWGWNLSGQLGDGTTVDALTPVVVSPFP